MASSLLQCFFNAIILRSSVNYCEIIKPGLLVLVGSSQPKADVSLSSRLLPKNSL